jgi:putative phage-type endonuclease
MTPALTALLAQPVKNMRLTQNTPKWLAARRTMRTASETPVVMNLSPWQKPGELAMVKFNGAPKEADNPQFAQGHKWEPVARREYENKMGITAAPRCVSRANYMASLDGLSADGRIVFECKCHSRWSPIWKTIRAGTIEPHYYAQIMHALMVSGAQVAHFYPWNVDIQMGTLLEFERNDAYFERIIAAWSEFEKRYA